MRNFPKVKNFSQILFQFLGFSYTGKGCYLMFKNSVVAYFYPGFVRVHFHFGMGFQLGFLIYFLIWTKNIEHILITNVCPKKEPNKS